MRLYASADIGSSRITRYRRYRTEGDEDIYATSKRFCDVSIKVRAYLATKTRKRTSKDTLL